MIRADWDAIEFTKTRGWERRDREDDELDRYEGLVAWCERRGLLSAAQARGFRHQASERPEQARTALEDARSLRSLMYEVLKSAGRGQPLSGEDLRRVTDWVQRFSGARRLVRAQSGIRWAWALDRYRLDHPLAPIAWSFGELLTAPELGRVRVCDADDCGWLFVDASRSGSRRWCEASGCGNLVRVREFRARRARR